MVGGFESHLVHQIQKCPLRESTSSTSRVASRNWFSANVRIADQPLIARVAIH